jgi:hypothetical protein
VDNFCKLLILLKFDEYFESNPIDKVHNVQSAFRAAAGWQGSHREMRLGTIVGW